MTWLLKLYPPQWRRRYGEEFRVLVAPLPFSIGTAIDIIGGAFDAWTQPQSHLSSRAASHAEGDTIMLAKIMRLRCAGYGAKTTVADQLKAAAVVIGGTLATVLVVSLMPHEPGEHRHRIAVLSNSWLFFFVISMRYTTLKGWPGRAQALFKGALISAIAAIMLAASWV